MRTRQICCFVASIAVVSWFSIPRVDADIAIYQDDGLDPITGAAYDGVADVTLSSRTGGRTQNFGQRIDLEATNFSGITTHSLLEFDITSLNGQYSAINSAKIRLYLTATPGIAAGANTLQLHQLTTANADWVEGPGVSSDSGNNFPGSSTWDEKIRGTQNAGFSPNGSGTLWAGSAGASTSGVDFDATLIAFWTFDGTESAGDFIDLQLTDLSIIDNWVTGNNPGMILSLQNSQLARTFYESSESTNQAVKPALIIDYNAIPEPHTSLVLVVAGLAAMRRRSRRTHPGCGVL